jgi:hypothetical protein
MLLFVGMLRRISKKFNFSGKFPSLNEQGLTGFEKSGAKTIL